MGLLAVLFTGLFYAANAAAAPGPIAGPLTRAAFDIPQYVLTPVESTGITLQAHTVNYHLSSPSDGALQLAVDAQYRLFNPGTAAVTQFLQLREMALNSSADAGTTSLNLPEPTLLMDGQPLGLQPGNSASYTAQIELGADARSTLRVQYTLSLAGTVLPLLRYNVGHLPQWPGDTSLRITMTLPESLPSDQWLRIEPAGWAYATSDNAREPSIQWLFEPNFTERIFTFQFINPAVGAPLRTAQQSADGIPSVATFGELARRYQQLYVEPAINSATDPGEIAIRDRFYAQALAAYLDGLESGEAANAAPTELGRLHAGLAALYRSRVVGAAQDEQYMALMIEEATRALDMLAADAPQRSELARWRLEGLYSVFQQARNRQDWRQALALLDELTAQLANGAVAGSRLSAEGLAEERRALLVQQALQVLAKGETDAAIALAGPEILNAALAPAPELQSLFAKWQISSTVTADGITIRVLAYPAATQADAARNALQSLSTRWQTVSPAHTITLDEALAQGDGAPLDLQIAAAPNTTHLALVQALPDNANWALLRSLLTQLNSTIDTSGAFLRRQTYMSQALDLRTVGDHWNAMVANLSQQATAYGAEATRLAGDGAGANEAALQAQIQEVNYNNAAQTWRQLLRNSRVTITLQPAADPAQSRSWLTTVESPPQLFKLQAQMVNPLQLLGFLTVMVLMIFGLSGLLWWLL